MADAVRRVLTDPRYAERAAAIGAELAAHGGVQRAVDLVETLATTREPIRRAEY